MSLYEFTSSMFSSGRDNPFYGVTKYTVPSSGRSPSMTAPV